MSSQLDNNKEQSKPESIIKELLIGFLELIAGSIYSKAAIILLLNILGLVLIICPMAGGVPKPLVFYILGGILSSIGIYLLISRVMEINRNKK